VTQTVGREARTDVGRLKGVSCVAGRLFCCRRVTSSVAAAAAAAVNCVTVDVRRSVRVVTVSLSRRRRYVATRTATADSNDD